MSGVDEVVVIDALSNKIIETLVAVIDSVAPIYRSGYRPVGGAEPEIGAR